MKFRKRIQKMQGDFSNLYSLLSDLLNILPPKVSPKPLKSNANQEDIYLTLLQLTAVTKTNLISSQASLDIILTTTSVKNDPHLVLTSNKKRDN